MISSVIYELNWYKIVFCSGETSGFLSNMQKIPKSDLFFWTFFLILVRQKGFIFGILFSFYSMLQKPFWLKDSGIFR